MWRDRSSGQTRQKTEWRRATVWGDGAAKYIEYAQKGTLLQVMGKLEIPKWTEQSDEDRYSIQVVVGFMGGGRMQIRTAACIAPNSSKRSPPLDPQPPWGATRPRVRHSTTSMQGEARAHRTALVVRSVIL